MAPRLLLDASVVAYYGFDEANVLDAALDESAAGRDLTVTAAAGVVQARLGNGRQFDGASTQAVLADPDHDDAFRLTQGMPLTVICWVTMDSALSSGSQRRTLFAFEGATGAPTDYTLYGLSVASDGAIHYEHQDDLGNWVDLATAAGTLRTGRYYSIALVRETVVSLGGDDDSLPTYNSKVTLYLDNFVAPWASVLYDGAPTGEGNLPIPSQYATNARLHVGHGAKRTDAFWHGVVDELSFHRAVRPQQPYLNSAYYRLALANAVTKLTAQGDIRAVGGAEMGGGSRWWVYERDRALYVIRENSLGLFTKEVLLTTGGVSPSGAPILPGNERPVVSYDAANDLLVVGFISSGRVYKVTARSGDVPSTQAMPLTADVGTIIKAVDSADETRVGAGEPARTADYGDSAAIATNVTLFYIPSFGVAFSGTNPYGYAVFQAFAGMDRLLGVVTSTDPGPVRTNYFVAVPQRQFGAAYYVVPILKSGGYSKNLTPPIYDYDDELTPKNDDPYYLFWNRAGDALVDEVAFGSGEPTRSGTFSQSSTIPIKIPVTDATSSGSGESVVALPFAQFTTTPIKYPAPPDSTIGVSGGDSLRAAMQRTSGPEVNL